VTAIVLPIVVNVGPAAVLATVAAAVVMILSRNEFAAVVTGVIVAAVARNAGL
jgi:hypothetical protein